MSKTPSVLLVEDSPSLAEVYKQYLSKEDIALLTATCGLEAIEMAERYQPQLVLLDLKLPDMPGEDVLSHIKKIDNDCVVIIITAYGSVDIAVDLMRLGAQDFLQKPIDAARLLTTVNNSLENIKLKSLVADLSENFNRDHFHGFIGSSMPMQAVYKTIEAASSSSATIFITGESGTGKEVCAEAIHKQSARSSEAFIALNCGAIPKDLMESEIFGHVKGAFTGASSDRKGAASLANNGTLFLDEIGEMDLDLQTKLLRFIQSGVIKKVGGSKEEKLNVRFICATNRDPLTQVAEGTFREDLYYRLNVVPIHLPALRERNGDIVKIAQHFLKLYAKEDGKKFKRLGQEVKQLMNTYAWPGNVRQLQNIIRNVVVLNNAEVVELNHLPPPLSPISNTAALKPSKHQAVPLPSSTAEYAASSQESDSAGEYHLENHQALNKQQNIQTDLKVNEHDKPHFIVRPLAEVERETIEQTIQHCDGNIPKAAALLEVSPSTIYRKKQQWH
ncbi:sigma-54-dependent transcriptional regulator [Agaribacterium sp. ZY112]|uniref:sigma-54-dependent transcriptional regulator n=1 Tax=Agaribacterium sp. ZY112 TaxID=3233574 RepID=UPI0035233B76